MMTTNHTALPWQVSPLNPDIVQTADKTTIAETYAKNCDANAAFIVRCVNAHDELVAALRMIDTAHANCVRYADVPGSGTDWRSYCLALADIARAALAKVQA